MSYIYDIETINGHYIGKLANTEIYSYHLEHAAPLFINGKESFGVNNKDEGYAGEYDGRESILEKGLANSNFVQQIKYLTYQTVMQKLKPTLGNDIGKFFSLSWNKGDYEVTEAFTIILARNSFETILNTKIDFMGFNNFRSENGKETLFSLEEYERKFKAAFSDIINHQVTLTNQDIGENSDFGKSHKLKSGSKINIGGNKEFQKQYNYQVNQKTLEHYEKEFQNFLNKLPIKFKNKLKKYIEEEIQKRKDNRQLLNDLKDDVLQQGKSEIFSETRLGGSAFSDFMSKWLQENSTFIKATWKQGSISHENYKKAFTNAMQKTIGKHNIKIKNRHLGRSVIKQVQDKEKLITMFNSSHSKRPTRRSKFIDNISGKSEFLKTKADEIGYEQAQILYKQNGMDYTKITKY